MSIPLKTEDARTIAGTALTGSFQNIGTATSNPARMLFVWNGCDQPITLSWDGGVTSGFVLPANSAFSVDCSINKEANKHAPMVPIGALFQAMHNGVAPTAGNLSISVVY